MSNNFNQKEYNSVVLGGLLHDIGKFMNRAKDIHKKHPYCSEQFVSDDTEKFKKLCKEEWVDFELLKTICKRHHENPQLGDELLVQKINDEKIRSLAYIVSRADNYSSAEREKNESYDGEAKNIANFKKNRLASIFSEITISGENSSMNNKKSHKYLRLKKLSPSASFAVNIADAEATDYSGLYDEFGSELKKLEGIKKYNLFYNALYSIFENTLTSVPSDASQTEGDVSLFDHLSTTSAIAACLYQYHAALDDFSEKSVKDDTAKKFCLFHGDLSGIQKFIFNIKSRNPKKLAKTLRGRSYFLGLLADAASIYILKELNMPLACRIMNAGGNFTLLIPNTKECLKKLDEVKTIISEYMLNMFAGELSFFTSYTEAFSGEKFTGKCDEFKKIFEQLKEKISIEKNSAYKDILWNEKNVFGERYNLYAINGGECSLCGIHPKKHIFNDAAEGGKEDMRCEICDIAANIGELILSKNAVAFVDEKETIKDHKQCLTLFGMNILFIDSKDLNRLSGDDIDKFIFLYHLNGIESKETRNNGYYVKYVSTYIPHLTEKMKAEICDDIRCEGICGALCDYCSESNTDCMAGENKRPAYKTDNVKIPLYFQCISIFDKKRFIEENKKIWQERGGIEALAILKADVDRLGAIFNNGLKTYTISRVASLSRSLDYFFTGVLPDMIKKEYPYIYTVYAGGDDLFLIGPWFKTIEFAIELRKKFKAYSCDNPDISISTAVHLMKPNDAIAVQAELAEEMLAKAKHAGRDKITLFGTPIKWEKEKAEMKDAKKDKKSENISVEEIVNFGKYLSSELKDENSKVTMAFLYRLLKYHKMYLKAKNEGQVESLIFHSKMNYDIQRNIINIKDGEIVNGELLEKLEPLYKLSRFESEGEALMKKLNVALSVAIYANRKS